MVNRDACQIVYCLFRRKQMNKNLKILFCEQNIQVVQGLQHFFSQKDADILFCNKDGNLLLEKIKEFQQKRGLVVDGSCGPNTWKKLLGIN